MTNRFNDPWNRAIDGADGPQDGMQKEDIEELLKPGAHDVLPHPALFRDPQLEVIVDCKDFEVLLERGAENVIVKEEEINSVIAKFLKAKDLFKEMRCKGK